MKRNPVLHGAWLGAVVVSLSCLAIADSSAGRSAESETPSASAARSTPSATTEPEDDFPRDPDPVTVHAVLDSGQSFSNALTARPGLAFIGQIGGQTPEDIEFTIQLPEGLLALDADGVQVPAFGTLVTVTPVSEIPDIPFPNGYRAAFHLAPEGLLMVEPASLDITVPGEYEPGELVGFAADGTGEDFHLFPVVSYVIEGRTMVLFNVMHFSLYGVARLTLQEIEAQHDKPPAKPDSQDEDELAPLVPVTEDTKNQDKLRKSHNRTVQPYIDKLSNLDCNKVGVAAYEFQKWYGRVDQAGEVNHFQDKIRSDGDALLSRLKECVRVNCPNCAGGSANRKSVDLFLVLSAWGESISKSLGDFEGSFYWRGLGNMCAEQAGVQPPHPSVAGDCMGDECEATPTPLQCP